MKVLGCANDRAAVAERDSRLGWRDARPDARRRRPVRRVDSHARRVGRARSGESDCGLAAVRDRAYRRRAGRAAARGRRGAAAGGRAGAGSVAHHRGAGGRAGARAAWRGRVDGQRSASAEHRAAGDRQRARQAFGCRRSARCSGARDIARPRRAAPMCFCRRIGRARWRRAASVPRSWRGCGRESSMCRFPLMGTRGRGRSGAASIVWCSRRAGLPLLSAQAAGWDEPKHLPCQALDHATGYLAAFGAMVALARRATEGGSWHVRVSLAQTGPVAAVVWTDRRRLASRPTSRSTMCAIASRPWSRSSDAC